jgi:REP element-mobilizing transposase RayT
MPDHVHLLVSLKPAGCRATYIGQIKGALAHAHNKAKIGPEPLVWQEGYGILTVPKSHTDRIADYVDNQQDIHARRKANRLLECTEQDAE